LLRRFLASVTDDLTEGHGGDSDSAGIEEGVPVAAAHWGVHAPRLHRHAAFLGIAGGSSSSSAGIPPESNVEPGVRLSAVPLRGRRTSFGANIVGVELGPVRTQLVYQSPEIYKTDISSFEKKLMKKPFDDEYGNGYGDGVNPMRHPAISFWGWFRTIYVHTVDKNTGEVFWDATYKIRPSSKNMSKLTSTNVAIPTSPGTEPMFKQFWIPKNDPGPHLFDTTICTRENYFTDSPDNEWGEREGFDNLYGTCAHIGVEAYRLPKLEDCDPSSGSSCEPGSDPLHPAQEEIVDIGPDVGNTDVHQYDVMERIINKEEDPFIVPEDAPPEAPKPGLFPLTPGEDSRLYYGWMIERTGIERQNYQYLWHPKEPPLVLPNWVDYSKPHEPGEPIRVPGDDAANPVTAEPVKTPA